MNIFKRWSIEIYISYWEFRKLSPYVKALLVPCKPSGVIVVGKVHEHGKTGTYKIRGWGKPPTKLMESLKKEFNQFMHLDMSDGTSWVWGTHHNNTHTFDDKGRAHVGVPVKCRTEDVMNFWDCDL